MQEPLLASGKRRKDVKPIRSFPGPAIEESFKAKEQCTSDNHPHRKEGESRKGSEIEKYFGLRSFYDIKSKALERFRWKRQLKKKS